MKKFLKTKGAKAFIAAYPELTGSRPTLAASVLRIDPKHAGNITVYHVNPHKYGAKPVNMDTGDATGDLFFDLISPRDDGLEVGGVIAM